MTILLTGSEGNLGTAIRRLARRPVIGIDRKGWPDLEAALFGVKTVIHAASDLRTHAAKSPTRLMDSNIMMTAALLEAAARKGVDRFVFISSCAVYGEDMRTSEDSICCPISINGLTKLLNEKLIKEFCEAHRMQHQILRVFNTYGGCDQFSILYRLQQALQRGTPFILNNEGRMLRDFIHVADVATIVLQLLDCEVRHSHLNIGTGIATKISTLVDLVSLRFPALVVQPGKTIEAEYSRADISRLCEYFSPDFQRVEDYVRESFGQC